MIKKFFALILTLIFLTEGLLAFSVAAEELPADCPVIEFDKRYRAEPGESYWYKFTAPCPYLSFSDMQIEPLGDYLYGWDVYHHNYYDSKGNNLGQISYTNDPDVSEWTEFEVGQTYYIKVKGLGNGTFYTLSPVWESEPDTDSTDIKGEKPTLTLTQEGCEKSIQGYTNRMWDVYTLERKNGASSENEITVSDYFVLPYQVHFDSAELTVGGRSVYGNITKNVQDNWDSLKSFEKKPCSAKENIPENWDVTSASFCAYSGEAFSSAKVSYKIYLPSGNAIKVGADGCIYPLEIDERFDDVNPNAWYTEAVSWCAENRIMKGTASERFSPSALLTRAQFVLILANMESVDLEPYKDRQSFTDVPKGRWYSTAVEWAKEKGVTSGVSETKFAPNASVTRQQLTTFLCNYAKINSVPLPEGASLEGYSDSNKISSWARESVAVAVSAGWIKGMTQTTLAPRANATRAQIALIIKNFYTKHIDLPKGKFLLEGSSSGKSFHGELLELCGKDNPHILYIGMASVKEEDGYGAIISLIENWSSSCSFELLTMSDLSDGKAESKIAAADIIYVNGGDSRMLLERLRKNGTDELIRNAVKRGCVMAGSSAGAICFGSYGSSGIRDNRYENIYGITALDLVICPHGKQEKRVEEMKKLLLSDASLVGIALDYCALEIDGDRYRIFVEEGYEDPPHAVKYYNQNGVVTALELETMEWRPIEELFQS